MDRIAKIIPGPFQGRSFTIVEAMSQEPKLKKLYKEGVGEARGGGVHGSRQAAVLINTGHGGRTAKAAWLAPSIHEPQVHVLDKLAAA